MKIYFSQAFSLFHYDVQSDNGFNGTKLRHLLVPKTADLNLIEHSLLSDSFAFALRGFPTASDNDREL